MSAWHAAAWGALAAVSLPIGALLALRFRMSHRLIGSIMGFGSGALISSIAYELVPDSRIDDSGWWLAVAFAAGALTFFAADWVIDERGGAERKRIAPGQGGGAGAAIFLGTLLDAVPESMILGIGVATGGMVSVAFLISVFVSNLPEGIAGTRSLVDAGHSARQVLAMWIGLVVASAGAAVAGCWLVQSIPAADGRTVRAFAGGAVLTMLADVMMPEAFEHGGKIVGLVATAGFLAAAILSVLE